MNILFTICGRAGSKGIKNKNIKEFLGYPLPLYSLSVIDLYIKENPDINADIVLNTDSKDLMNIIKDRVKLNIDLIERDISLGLDNTSKIDVILNCLESMKNKNETEYTMVVDLDITSPLRTVNDLKALIQKKLVTDSDVVFSVTESRRNPYFNMVKKTENGFERVISSEFNTRQEAPEILDMNASLYAYSPIFLESGQGIFDGKCEVIKMLDTAILDIDNENDFEFMEIIANYLFSNYEEFKLIRENINSILNY